MRSYEVMHMHMFCSIISRCLNGSFPLKKVLRQGFGKITPRMRGFVSVTFLKGNLFICLDNRTVFNEVNDWTLSGDDCVVADSALHWNWNSVRCVISAHVVCQKYLQKCPSPDVNAGSYIKTSKYS